MKEVKGCILIVAVLIAACPGQLAMRTAGLAASQEAGGAPAAVPPAVIAIDYPQEGSIFPPEITAPTFLWRDPAENAGRWRIDVEFTGGSAAIQAQSPGERMRIGEIDPPGGPGVARDRSGRKPSRRHRW